MGEQSFKDLASYALACLTTPTSNAIVERIFILRHQYKDEKAKQNVSWNARSHTAHPYPPSFGQKCCKDFLVTEKMISLFNSDIRYTAKEDDDDLAILDSF